MGKDEERSYEENDKPDNHIYKNIMVLSDFLTEQDNSLGSVRVEQMTSTNSYRPVANQFEIRTNEGTYFQSYSTIIAFVPLSNKKTVLDVNSWDYSRTTSKYRGQFLGENTAETRSKIKSGEYILADLNK